MEGGVSVLATEDEEETVVPGGVVADIGEDEGVCIGEFGGRVEEGEVADKPLPNSYGNGSDR